MPRTTVESAPHREVGYLGQALALATKNGAAGRRPFASVLVLGSAAVSAHVDEQQDSGVVVCSEVLSIRAAIAERGANALYGGVLYCSAEPCTLCKRAIDWVGISRVVFGARREVAMRFGFDDPFAVALPPSVADRPNAELVERLIASIDEPFLEFERFRAKVDHPR